MIQVTFSFLFYYNSHSIIDLTLIQLANLKIIFETTKNKKIKDISGDLILLTKTPHIPYKWKLHSIEVYD